MVSWQESVHVKQGADVATGCYHVGGNDVGSLEWKETKLLTYIPVYTFIIRTFPIMHNLRYCWIITHSENTVSRYNV